MSMGDTAKRSMRWNQLTRKQKCLSFSPTPVPTLARALALALAHAHARAQNFRFIFVSTDNTAMFDSICTHAHAFALARVVFKT